VRAVIQRAARASVRIGERQVAQIERGLMVLLGVEKGDTEAAAARMAEKICHLRIFESESGHMDRSLLDVGGAALIVSQFTLCADCSKGRRPSFDPAAEPKRAEELYEAVCARVREAGVTVQTGEFGAKMVVAVENDGPVTIVLNVR
jgi:D-tyrosyl-tRNA(Tyr) deacylase